MIANLNNLPEFGVSTGRPYLSPIYWYEVLNVLHDDYTLSDTNESFAHWIERNWRCKLLMNGSAILPRIESVEFDSLALTALMLRFPFSKLS